MSLYAETIAMFGRARAASARFSGALQAAKPCARLPHDSFARCGPERFALSIFARYAARSTALRVTMRSVTAANVGCSAISDAPSRRPVDVYRHRVLLHYRAHGALLDRARLQRLLVDGALGRPEEQQVDLVRVEQ